VRFYFRCVLCRVYVDAADMAEASAARVDHDAEAHAGAPTSAAGVDYGPPRLAPVKLPPRGQKEPGQRGRNLRAKLAARDGWACCWCAVELTQETATIEHVRPRAHGGSSKPVNLKLACGPCNHRRGAPIDPAQGPPPPEGNSGKPAFNGR
jgi:ferredoxin